MKMIAKWILLTGILGVILTGCGTSDDNNDGTNGAASSEDIEQVEQNENAATNNNGADENQNDETGLEEENTEDASPRNPEQNIKYQVNGETKEETAVLKESDNQNYSLYVLPEYELTAEEPNKDSLYLSEDGQVFMRIEILPTDMQWDTIVENTKAQLAAVNEEVETVDVPSEDFFKDSIAMKSSTDEDIVTAYIIKNGEQPFKFTIFSKKDSDYSDAFLQMGKTIKAGKTN
ncbi:hypothetical protein [Cytobacillus praedii]|uniref:Lipoprotein n=1 Tax=Cytobacillus praedii TaxID=1742358 RepID=A0A4R1B1A7_9BACI|nr:hypothetical protein [Cytobacillus praedii]TCJ06183.1 hypothetical protein E0Y62_02815 [Cytobacillus praedii]